MLIYKKNGYNLITNMINHERGKEIFRQPEIETNKYLFLKTAIINRKQNKNIFKIQNDE
jgi:hypothetical protein|tara:strand:+ start:1178 stop:1354 length:177 start_codon:yes stop_codon:yes gene_type:complete